MKDFSKERNNNKTKKKLVKFILGYFYGYMGLKGYAGKFSLESRFLDP